MSKKRTNLYHPSTTW